MRRCGASRFRWLQSQCSRRQRANNLSWGQPVKLREHLKSLAGKVAAGAEHTPEHVVNERPLGHADDLTVALCDQHVRNRTLAEVCGTQHLRRARMVLGWMTLDETMLSIAGMSFSLASRIKSMSLVLGVTAGVLSSPRQRKAQNEISTAAAALAAAGGHRHELLAVHHVHRW